MIQTQQVKKVPLHTSKGQKFVDVAVMTVGNQMILMAFEEQYVNRGVIIGEMTAKIVAQMDKNAPVEAPAQEEVDAAGDQVQDQGSEAAPSHLKAVESESPAAQP